MREDLRDKVMQLQKEGASIPIGVHFKAIFRMKVVFKQMETVYWSIVRRV